MSHCPPCNHDCEQSDTCPTRAGHVLPTTPGGLVQVPYLRRTYEELGVCQAYIPRCGLCINKAAGNMEVNVVAGLDSLCAQIFYWFFIVLMGVCSVITFAGVAGFIYARYFQ